MPLSGYRWLDACNPVCVYACVWDNKSVIHLGSRLPLMLSFDVLFNSADCNVHGTKGFVASTIVQDGSKLLHNCT